MQDHLNGIKTHQEKVYKSPNLSFIVFLFIFFIGQLAFGQSNIKIDKEKWIADEEIYSLNINSYRAFIINQGNFLDIVKGKSKKEIINLLGEADFINKKSFKKIKGRIGFVYCVGKNTKNIKCRKCEKASITIIFDNGFVTDLIGVFSGG